MDIVTLGEALIDLPSTESGVGLADAPAFAPVAAGAPANVAVAASALGLSAAFVSKVGDDPFGEKIVQTFADFGVDTSHIVQDADARTGLAFVSLRHDGEREFLFYFDPARDLALRPDELPAALLSSCRVFHFGSISRIAEPSRSATVEAVRLARAGGALISYDPNLRPRLWPDEETMRTQAWAGLAGADVVKVSEEELTFLTPDAANEADAAKRVFEESETVRLLAVTRGANGSTGYARDGEVADAPGVKVTAVDATGAGDAFMAGLIFAQLRGDDVMKRMRFANACGALATTKRGAAPFWLTVADAERLAR